jgi:hypothetical protein
MKLLSRLRDHPKAPPCAAGTPLCPAQVVYSRDEFLDPSDPTEFEPVVCGQPSAAEERRS